MCARNIKKEPLYICTTPYYVYWTIDTTLTGVFRGAYHVVRGWRLKAGRGSDRTTCCNLFQRYLPVWYWCCRTRTYHWYYCDTAAVLIPVVYWCCTMYQVLWYCDVHIIHIAGIPCCCNWSILDVYQVPGISGHGIHVCVIHTNVRTYIIFHVVGPSRNCSCLGSTTWTTQHDNLLSCCVYFDLIRY